MLSDARHTFRIWRRTRPFWGGLLVIAGACEILTSEQGPLELVIHIGIQGMAGYLIPVMLLLCGALLWFNPAQRAFYSLLAIVLALGSWITSNLGGFFIGMLLGLVGGALAFAWATAPDRRPLKWFSGNPQVLQPSSGVDLVLRPTAVLPPPGRAELISADGRGGSGYRAPDSADKPGIGLVSIDTLGMVMTGPSTSTTLPQDDDGDHRPHGRLSNVTQPQDDASRG